MAMLLPFAAWSLTALYFVAREGNGDAYERLVIRHYPVEQSITIPAGKDWEEVRYVHSVLGSHLLVRENGAWRHLDPQQLKERHYPSEDALRLLVADALTANPRRYGDIALIDGRRIRTTTGVEITRDWNALALSQEGRDTRWINRLYSIHYLEWTGIALLDRLLGIVGLCLLIYMTWSGAQLAFGWGRRGRRSLAREA